MIRIRNIPALFITAIVLIIAFIFFALKISGISVPAKYIEKGITNVRDTVKVFKNHYGIPHVVTNNEHDAFFMVGYLHAQDRLWQMDYMRRLARGMLSEIFGSETINVDRYMRSLSLNRTAEKLWKSADGQSKRILEAYADGVNYFIDNNKSRLPFEFNAMNFIPKHWHPVDSYLVGRLLSLSMSNSLMADVAYGEIAEKIGVKKALELVPSYPSNVPFIMDDSIPKVLNKAKQGDTLKAVKPIMTEYRNILKNLSDVLAEVRNTTGLYGASNGSNSWVAKKYPVANSGVVIANDPHLQLTMPAHWYQLHLTFPGYNVVGFTFPGEPLFMAGRNNNIAWGITNLMLDDCDIFIEKVDSANSNFYYLLNGKKEKFTFVKDTIKVKNDNDIYYYKKMTRRSAVISDVHLMKYKDKDYKQVSGDKFFSKYCMTFSWTGQFQSNELLALYCLNKAKDWNQFLKATNDWGSPALCFTYADNHGNYGVTSAGLIPKRNLTNPNIPNPSWMDGYAWEGFRNCSELPKSFNPSKKFVVSANNVLSRHFPYFLTSYWEPPSRSVRISELLQIHTEYSARDAQIMQSDVLSMYAKQILNTSIPIIGSMLKSMTDKEKQAFYILKKWDFIVSPLSVGASIFNVFSSKLIYNTFADELGEKLFNDFLSNQAFAKRKITELVQDSVSSEWFDDVRTNQKEYKNYILMKSLRDAVSYLEQLLDEHDMNKWYYGKLHQITFKHAFSGNKFLEPSVNSGPYQIGGDGTTINNTEYSMKETFEVTKYASMRFVADMEENIIYSVVPGGSSGDPQSPNYRDQLQLWLNGGYVQLPVSSVPDNSFGLSILFYPK